MTQGVTRAGTAEFTEFYAATFHRVAAQLYAYLGDHAEAQDLTQEAFCRALDRWRRVGTYENPGAWVRQVAWNLATSRLRHLQVIQRFVAGQREDHAPPPGPERVDLTRALAALPSNHRLAVVLHHVGRLSTSEIAQQRGVAEGTVRSWLSRGRAQLAEQLVDWEQVAVKAPAGGAEAVAAKVRRRRAGRRAVVAAALAVLVALPVALFLMARRGEPPIIEPTPPPSISPSPAPSLETRQVSFPDLGTVNLRDIRFVDRDHAWLWHDPCVGMSGSAPPCRTLAVTADGAKTWRRVTVPSMPDKARAVLLAFDADTASLQVTEEMADKPSNYWHTKDGGATFTSHPVERPPAEAVISQGGRYMMLCPGATGLEDGAWGSSCERRQLVKIGSGPMAEQPPLRTPGAMVFEGADGRLWLYAETPRKQLFVSDDVAQSWRELPWPAAEVQASLTLSPDGKQAWVLAVNSLGELWLFELVGSEWVKRDLEFDRGMVPVLLDDGIWLVRHRDTYAYLKDGVYTAIPGVSMVDGGGRVLRDGTVVLYSGSEIYLGSGAGMRREWVRITT
ncbi:MAG TPA: sigma-70 family RNA polymerase sigma factor [Candidatus Limnocylindrales bacterium]